MIQYDKSDKTPAFFMRKWSVSSLFCLNKLILYTLYNIFIIMIKILLVTLCFCIFSAVFSYEDFLELPEIHYTLEIRARSTVLARKQLVIICSKRYFEQYKDELSVTLDIPTSELPYAQLVVSYKHYAYSKDIIIQKKWKLAKQMPQVKNFYGIEKIFGIDIIGLTFNQQKKIMKYTTKNAYLKIAYSDRTLKKKETKGYNRFYINQNEILDRKDYIPLQAITGQTFTLTVIPEIFIQNELYKLYKAYIEQLNAFQKIDIYYISLTSNNKTSFNQEIQFSRKSYQNHIAAMEQTMRQMRSNKEDHLQGTKDIYQLYELMVTNSREQLKNLQFLEGHIQNFSGQSMKIFKQYVIILIQVIIGLSEMIKKVIFFNDSGYYTFALITAMSSFVMNYFFYACLVFNIFLLAFNYKKHIGLSLAIFYIEIFRLVFNLLPFDDLQVDQILYLLLLISLFLEKMPDFPYYSLRIRKDYQKLWQKERSILTIIGISGFALFVASFLFYRIVFFGMKQSAYEIYRNIDRQYYIMFALLSQVLMNNYLKSVKHLTKWYVIFAVAVALSDNGLILLNLNPINILLKLKQDILVLILLYQISLYEDLNQGTIVDTTRQAIKEAELRRQRQIQAMLAKNE